MATNTPPTDTPASPARDWLGWLRRLNTLLSNWAASLSWWRMLALGLIAMLFGSWISEVLNLAHDKPPKVKVVVVKKSETNRSEPAAASTCESEELRIGGDKGIVLCGKRRAAAPALPASSGATPAASSPSPGPSAAAPAVPGAVAPLASAPAVPSASEAQSGEPVAPNSSQEDTEDEETPDLPAAVRHTLGGWVHDLASALLLALFAYLIAAKVIMRKSAEADAKLRVANDSVEREALERQVVQARLKLLQAQIEPHFLFNTLAAVDYLIETDPPRASVMQKTLIAYLRAALPQMRQESSTLGQEVALIRSYLALLKMRIEDRLEFDIDVPAGLHSAVFPPLVLQTLVENAIKHGIEPKPDGGRVRVRAEIVDGLLQVDVQDTGLGLPTPLSPTATSSGTGLGLDNIRHRLALLYPGVGRLSLSSPAAGGTLARVVVPYQTQARQPGASA